MVTIFIIEMGSGQMFARVSIKLTYSRTIKNKVNNKEKKGKTTLLSKVSLKDMSMQLVLTRNEPRIQGERE